jgi:hypothetical protein
MVDRDLMEQGSAVAEMHPSRDECRRLSPPLTEGEWKIARALARLGHGWSIHVRPRFGLDGLSFVAVHDQYGVCAIDVHDGDAPSLEWCVTNVERSLAAVQRVAQAAPGREAATMRSVLAVMRSSTGAISSAALRLHGRPATIVGGDVLDSLGEVVRGGSPDALDAAAVARVRAHLDDHRFQFELRRPVPTSAGVRAIELNEQGLRLQQVRGRAGSGKSFALAARAARLASEGRRVLVVAADDTALARLGSMIAERCHERAADPGLVVRSTFDDYCQRVVDDARIAGVIDPDDGTNTDPWVVARTMDDAAQALGAAGAGTRDVLAHVRFDAVLVDDGHACGRDQWDVLRLHVVRRGGEMMITFDPAYDSRRRSIWGNVAQTIAAGGFARWIELVGSELTGSEAATVDRVADDALERPGTALAPSNAAATFVRVA